MRNFKKFLALVLAMLMVSACAVSVSAYQFADQDAIVAADVNDAVNALADLGVIKGREDGKFYPNDTLTREEACVIFAKLRAGSEGQKYEWLEETTVFPDVTAKDIGLCIRNMALAMHLLTIPTAVGHAAVVAFTRRAGKITAGKVMSIGPNPKCGHLDPQLLELYNQALVRFPNLLEQLSHHMAYGEPFGDDFRANFNRG